ncbi:MAG TPA: hypothetical protein VFS43_06615 [Polyangiaceae bacterium]|nr:hypothetical protein [Polyangiaceae bacterium]
MAQKKDAAPRAAATKGAPAKGAGPAKGAKDPAPPKGAAPNDGALVKVPMGEAAPASAGASALERGAAARAAAPPGANELFKTLGLRLGLPLAALWIFAIWLNHWAGYLVSGGLTAAALGFAFWVYRRLRGTQHVATILQKAQGADKEGRKAALSELDATFKKDDVAAALARAQLLVQDDPERALEVLQSVDLTKAMPAEADQVRVQRAMLHLVRGEVDRARPLADAVELTRTEDGGARAALAAVVAEAWARSGQAKKALTTLDVFNADDEALGDIRWQLWRSRAFAHAATNDPKLMRRALKKLAAHNPQFLAGFLGKKVHPLLEREARQMLMQSGAVPRKMQFQRR